MKASRTTAPPFSSSSPTLRSPDGGRLDTHHVAHVDRAQARKADQLARAAVDIGAAIEDQHRAQGGGKGGRDAGALDTVMETEQHGGPGEDGAGIARRK